MSVNSVYAQVELGEDSASANGASTKSISIVPRIAVTQSFTDNVFLSTTSKQSEQITDISPGITIRSEGSSRLKGYLDYSRHELLYAQNTSGRSSQNALNAFGTLEALENRAFVDFSSNISQQSISALGAQSVSNSSLNSNRTESTALSLSPYIRGQFGNVASYVARYSLATSRSQSSLASDVTTRGAQLQLNSQSGASLIGWALSASRQSIDYSGAGRSTESDAVNGSLSYAVTPHLNASLTGGQESSNYTGLSKETSWTSGLAINWRPSENTQVTAARQNRPFGESHQISFDHRTPKTAWRFSDSRDVTSTPSQTGFASLGSIYDIYFSQFASIEPDPIKRAALVNAFLQANGISPNTSVISSFLTSAVSLQRRQEVTIALLGVRDTLTFVASRSESSRLDTVVGVNDDLSNSALVRQSGLSVNYAHKLTPETAFNVLVSTQQASSSQGVQESITNFLNFSLTTTVGRHSTANLGLRRVAFESGTTPYTETAVTGTLNVAF